MDANAENVAETTDKRRKMLVMPAKMPHAVYVAEPFKWALTVVFPAGYAL